MKIVRISLIFLIVLVSAFSIYFLYNKKDNKIKEIKETKSKDIISDKTKYHYDFDVDGSGQLYCVGNGNATGLKVDINYQVIYKNGYITRLKSYQGVTKEKDEADISIYADAYEKLALQYKGIDYYDVSYYSDLNIAYLKQDINYELVDINKILEIEGKDNQIFDKNKKVKLLTWLNLGETFGTKCEKVDISKNL